MRVLVVSQYYWPETFIITAEVARLRAQGIEITVLTGKPNYPGGDVLPGYSAWSVQREWHEGTEIVRVPIIPRGRNSALRLVLNYMSFVLSAALLGPFVLRGRSFETVFVYALSPIVQALPAILIARWKQARLVLWVQDLWPESLSATGFVKNRRILAIVGHVVRFIYCRCDRILVQSRAFRAPVTALTDDPDKIHYLPNPVPDLAMPSAISEACQSLADEIDASFSIVFAGNLGRAQALDLVLDAAQRLRDLPDVRLFLIGSGSMEPWLRAEVSRQGLTNVTLPGRFPSEAMPILLPKASAFLVSLRAEEIFAYTVPSKLQTYFAIGRPVIAMLEGEGAAILNEAGAGITCPPGDAEALALAIRTMYETSARDRQAMGAAARAYFEAEFAPDKITAALKRHLIAACDVRYGRADHVRKEK